MGVDEFHAGDAPSTRSYCHPVILDSHLVSAVKYEYFLRRFPKNVFCRDGSATNSLIPVNPLQRPTREVLPAEVEVVDSKNLLLLHFRLRGRDSRRLSSL